MRIKNKMTNGTQYQEISDISTQLDDVKYAIFGVPYQPKFQEKPTSTLGKKVTETNKGKDETGTLVRYLTGEEKPVSPRLDTETLENNNVDL